MNVILPRNYASCIDRILVDIYPLQKFIKRFLLLVIVTIVYSHVEFFSYYNFYLVLNYNYNLKGKCKSFGLFYKEGSCGADPRTNPAARRQLFLVNP